MLERYLKRLSRLLRPAECVGGFQAARVFDNGIKYRHRLGISHRWVIASSVLVLVTQCTLQSGQSVLLPENTSLSPVLRVLKNIWSNFGMNEGCSIKFGLSKNLDPEALLMTFIIL